MGAPSAEVVLADLGDFCRARSAPFVAGDAIATGVLIGQQEVFHRIARYLNLAFKNAEGKGRAEAERDRLQTESEEARRANEIDEAVIRLSDSDLDRELRDGV